MLKWIHVFRVGTHKGSENFSSQQIQKMAEVYDRNLRMAVICENHPANDLPSYGEVLELQATPSGNDLLALINVHDVLVNAARSGAFTGVSCSFLRPAEPRNPRPGAFYLRHIGFLTEMNPAVKGLLPVEFCETRAELEAHVVSFSDYEADHSCVDFSVAPGCTVDSAAMVAHKKALRLQRVFPKLSYIEAIKRVGYK